jgi:hypothetical protein
VALRVHKVFRVFKVGRVYKEQPGFKVLKAPPEYKV